MASPNGEALARAAYERLDTELRRQRWRLLGAAFVCIAFAAVMFVIVWAMVQPVGAPRLIGGTATGTLSLPDDEEHSVVLLVELDGGESIRVKPHEVVPIGARVLIKEGRNRFGKPIYELAGLAPTAVK